MTTTTMATMIPNDPLAAAIAAAAELAKNGGTFLYNNNNGNFPRSQAGSPVPAAPLSSKEPEASTKNPQTIPNYDEEEEEEEERRTMSARNNDHEDEEEEEEEDSERRIARSRERNREHARKTRLRKKAQLEALQSRVKGLQAESQVLKQSLEECSIATILVGLSRENHRDTVLKSLLQNALADSTTTNNQENPETILQMVGGKRKRFISIDSSLEAKSSPSAHPLRLKINGRMTVIGGGRTHINWKTGVYSDENGVQKQLTNEQLESLRRERNRMHAKMTRDRKKNFIATIEKAINELESKNVRMKEVLSQVVQTHFPQATRAQPTTITTNRAPPCLVSPDCTAMVAPSGSMSPLSVSRHSEQDENLRPIKKVCHGFTLASA